MNLNDVISWIGTASKEDMDLVQQSMTFRRNIMSRAIARSYQPGDRVKFNGGRNKGTIRGKFVRLLNKNAEVLSDTGGRWRVAPSLLEDDMPLDTPGAS